MVGAKDGVHLSFTPPKAVRSIRLATRLVYLLQHHSPSSTQASTLPYQTRHAYVVRSWPPPSLLFAQLEACRLQLDSYTAYHTCVSR